MLNTILDLIKTKPKHYAKIVKATPALLTWVNQHTKISDDNLAAKIYSATTGSTNICNQGNTKRFISINSGWGFCGRANECQCANKSVSEKCKQSASTRDWNQSITKRRETNMKKYGHVNAAQSNSTREKHAAYYTNNENKNRAVDNYKNTMIERYGVTNPLQLAHVKEKQVLTMVERYGVPNPQQNKEINDRSQRTKKLKYNERYLIETSYDRISQKYKELGYTILTNKTEYVGVDQKNTSKYHFQHDLCRNKFETYIYCGHNPVCPLCYYKQPSFVSKAETELADWIETLGVRVVRTERYLISPLHIDIYLPDHNLAIEYCGLYWHSQRANGKATDYHKNKLNRCNTVGLNLITIFEDEWLTNKELVKSILSTRLGVVSKVGARKCKLKEVTNSEVKEFINKNHLQAHTNASVNVALTYENKIVSVMSFGKSRYNKKYEWELLRFCTKQGISIVGGAQKIWKYFLNSQNPTSIISYCDLRWFTGDTYKKLGMSLLHETGPSYWYTNYTTRFHRSNFTKKKLVQQGHDINKTENQIMIDLHFDRIWDCGNRVYGTTM